MENLHIRAEKKSPEIEFEKYSGLFRISGKSNLENPGKFYDKVILWLEEYIEKPAVNTTFKMQMEYFNSSSAKHLMRIFRALEKCHVDGKSQIVIEWYYHEHDGSMVEAGEDYASMLRIPFEYVEEKDD